MQKEIENFEFVQRVISEFKDLLKNNGTKDLLFFDDSYEEIGNSKTFVLIATAGRHLGVSTFHIKTNLFHQSKIGQDMENRTRTLFFSSLPVMRSKSVRLMHNWDSDQN